MGDPRNVVHVTVDSLRADHCGFLGGDADLTPTLDDVADAGVVYENAYAPAGATRASSAAFLTGRYPHDRPTGETTAETTRQHWGSADTLPERLSRRGYETAVFTANPHVSRYYLEEGLFDRFEDWLGPDGEGNRRSAGDASNPLSRLLNWWRGQEMFMTWEAVYDDIADWLATASEPYYCWVFLVDPHMPYLTPSEYRTRSRALNYLANAALYADRPGPVAGVLRDAYRDTVRYTDAFFAELLPTLSDDTALVVHADHGESFGETGAYGPHDETAAYGHGNVHEHVLQVPLVVGGPPAARVGQPVSLTSLPRMVTDLATGNAFDPERYTEPYVRARLQGPERVLRGRDWKYVWTPAGDGTFAVEGPGETVATSAPDLAAACRELVRGWERTTEERRAVVAAAAETAADRPL